MVEHYMPLDSEDSTSDDSTLLLVDGTSVDDLENDTSKERIRYSGPRGSAAFGNTFVLLGTILQAACTSIRSSMPSQEVSGLERQVAPWFSLAAMPKTLRAVLVALRPTILSPPRRRKIHPTSWLDGLRGVASFVVVIYHNCQVFYAGSCEAWRKDNPYFFQLPIVRLQCTGTAMVDIFFVVSGYALSYKPLSIARTHDFPRVASSLTSSVFRRGIRLYLPVVAITFLNALASYLQIFDLEGRDHVPYQADFGGTIRYWLNDLMTGLNPFHVDRYRSWDMMGLRYEPALEIDEKPANRDEIRPLLDKVDSICGLLVILYVLTIPDYHFGLGDVPFYSTIVLADPSSWAGLPDTGRFPVCVATVLLVFYLGQSQLFREILSSRFPQYLGENSFAIYLIHFFLINTMGRPLMRALYACKDILGLKEGFSAVLGDWLVLAFYAAVAVPVLFWSGELITHFVDRNSVELARWAESECMGSNTET